MSQSPLEIVYEDNHCCVVNKPAGVLTQGDSTGDLSLVELVGQSIKQRFNKPGQVYVGLLHRLDRPVSGLVLFARTSKAAARLSEDFRSQRVEKTYLAIVEGIWPESQESGRLVDYLFKDEGENRVLVVEAGSNGAKEATLDYRILRRRRDQTLMELRPRTGRSHQIRIQLASRGSPIMGDRKYGAKRVLKALDGGSRIALHAGRLSFIHPTRKEVIEVESPVPADWPDLDGFPSRRNDR